MGNAAGRKGKKKMWIGIAITAGIIAAVSAGGILFTEQGRREVRELKIAAMDFKKLRDGTYVGEYKGIKDHSRDTQIEATVSGGKLSGIKIKKGALDKTGNPAKLTGGLSIDDLFDKVIESQSLQVDVISGATLTSKAHLKGLENALEQAQVK
ncbi:MAG: FMN-binding domain protein [Paenibacillaceae bacterium]|jgi:uncharacterized protein with FMN-binding domain|nr:FMN-binding domain protein [Paenibacillaceae bacterium]